MRYARRVTAMISVALLIILIATQLPQHGTNARCPTLTTPVFTTRDTITGATDFTLSERSAAVSTDTIQLGVRFTAASEPGPRLTGVHLMIRGNDHFYSTVPGEIDAAVQSGYTDRGQQFWVSSDARCGAGVHRFTKNGISSYPLTSGDRKRLLSAGWSDAGVAFRATASTSFTWPTGTGKGPLDLAPYSAPDSLAWKAYRNAGTGSDRRTLYQLAATPSAIWLGPSENIRSYVDKITSQAAARDEAPQFVLYAIPHRDCGGYASGGLGDVASYRRWVDGIRAGLDGRPAVLIVEPDAIGMSCLSTEQANQRISMLRYAMQTLSSSDVWVYLHAGSAPQDPRAMASSLIKTGVEYARGFAVNVSGFDTTTSETAYGKQIVAALDADGVAGKHFIIDTSRNGAGRPPAGATGDVPRWCNPRGRALGQRPTTRTGDPEVDAFLWVKPPGETDGPCYAGDPAHGWFNSYAMDLVQAGFRRSTIAEIPTP